MVLDYVTADVLSRVVIGGVSARLPVRWLVSSADTEIEMLMKKNTHVGNDHIAVL